MATEPMAAGDVGLVEWLRNKSQRTEDVGDATDFAHAADVIEGLFEAVRVAEQLANIATDWNLSEVEIDGEMRSVYEMRDDFLAALAKAGRV